MFVALKKIKFEVDDEDEGSKPLDYIIIFSFM
jgi:hypothetical protein